MYQNNVSKHLNILHIFSGDLWAGAEVMVFNLISQLINCPNIRITALSLNEGTLSWKLQELGIRVFIIPEEKYSFPVILWKAKKVLRNLQVDIIHSHRYKENLLTIFLSKMIGVKRLVTTVHSLPGLTFNRNDGYNPICLQAKIDRFVVGSFFTCAVAVSHKIGIALSGQYGFKKNLVDVIHNGIDISQYINLPDQPVNLPANHIFHIGTVGRITPVKDYSFFLDVAAEIGKRRNDVHFHLLGDGPLKDSLVDKTKELRIYDIVKFHNQVSSPKQFYHTLDLYLNTSLNEGIPLTILEAMASGLPVIAPKVGGIPEIITDKENGIVMDDRDPVKYADICVKLLDNPKMKQELINAAMQTIKNKFSSEDMAKSYLRLYELIG